MSFVSQSEIKVECGASLDVDGIFQFVYIADGDDPAIEGIITWDEMISALVEEQCVATTDAIVVDYSNEFIEFGLNDGVQELMNYVDALRNAANDLEERIRSSRIFIRERWAEESRSAGALDDYCVTYAEYLDYVMEKRS